MRGDPHPEVRRAARGFDARHRELAQRGVVGAGEDQRDRLVDLAAELIGLSFCFLSRGPAAIATRIDFIVKAQLAAESGETFQFFGSGRQNNSHLFPATDPRETSQGMGGMRARRRESPVRFSVDGARRAGTKGPTNRASMEMRWVEVSCGFCFGARGGGTAP